MTAGTERVPVGCLVTQPLLQSHNAKGAKDCQGGGTQRRDNGQFSGGHGVALATASTVKRPKRLNRRRVLDTARNQRARPG